MADKDILLYTDLCTTYRQCEAQSRVVAGLSISILTILVLFIKISGNISETYFALFLSAVFLILEAFLSTISERIQTFSKMYLVEIYKREKALEIKNYSVFEDNKHFFKKQSVKDMLNAIHYVCIGTYAVFIIYALIHIF